jgi:predicted DsbA family dithiol-disulfide isomerase
MRRPRWSPNTVRAQEATIYAKEQGKDGQFHHLVAAAYWENSADIADLGALKGLAEASGLDWEELSPLLESGHYRDQVLQDYQAARETGVSGTPTYLIAGELLRGDVSLEDLQAAVAQARQG